MAQQFQSEPRAAAVDVDRCRDVRAGGERRINDPECLVDAERRRVLDDLLDQSGIEPQASWTLGRPARLQGGADSGGCRRFGGAGHIRRPGGCPDCGLVPLGAESLGAGPAQGGVETRQLPYHRTDPPVLVTREDPCQALQGALPVDPGVRIDDHRIQTGGGEVQGRPQGVVVVGGLGGSGRTNRPTVPGCCAVRTDAVQFADPEVDQPAPACGVEHDVVGLQIADDHTPSVDLVEDGQQPEGQLTQPARGSGIPVPTAHAVPAGPVASRPVRLAFVVRVRPAVRARPRVPVGSLVPDVPSQVPIAAVRQHQVLVGPVPEVVQCARHPGDVVERGEDGVFVAQPVAGIGTRFVLGHEGPGLLDHDRRPGDPVEGPVDIALGFAHDAAGDPVASTARTGCGRRRLSTGPGPGRARVPLPVGEGVLGPWGAPVGTAGKAVEGPAARPDHDGLQPSAAAGAVGGREGPVTVVDRGPRVDSSVADDLRAFPAAQYGDELLGEFDHDAGHRVDRDRLADHPRARCAGVDLTQDLRAPGELRVADEPLQHRKYETGHSLESVGSGRDVEFPAVVHRRHARIVQVRPLVVRPSAAADDGPEHS